MISQIIRFKALRSIFYYSTRNPQTNNPFTSLSLTEISKFIENTKAEKKTLNFYHVILKSIGDHPELKKNEALSDRQNKKIQELLTVCITELCNQIFQMTPEYTLQFLNSVLHFEQKKYRIEKDIYQLSYIRIRKRINHLIDTEVESHKRIMKLFLLKFLEKRKFLSEAKKLITFFLTNDLLQEREIEIYIQNILSSQINNTLLSRIAFLLSQYALKKDYFLKDRKRRSMLYRVFTKSGLQFKNEENFPAFHEALISEFERDFHSDQNSIEQKMNLINQFLLMKNLDDPYSSKLVENRQWNEKIFKEIESFCDIDKINEEKLLKQYLDLTVQYMNFFKKFPQYSHQSIQEQNALLLKIIKFSLNFSSFTNSNIYRQKLSVYHTLLIIHNNCSFPVPTDIQMNLYKNLLLFTQHLISNSNSSFIQFIRYYEAIAMELMEKKLPFEANFEEKFRELVSQSQIKLENSSKFEILRLYNLGVLLKIELPKFQIVKRSLEENNTGIIIQNLKRTVLYEYFQNEVFSLCENAVEKYRKGEFSESDLLKVIVASMKTHNYEDNFAELLNFWIVKNRKLFIKVMKRKKNFDFANGFVEKQAYNSKISELTFLFETIFILSEDNPQILNGYSREHFLPSFVFFFFDIKSEYIFQNYSFQQFQIKYFSCLLLILNNKTDGFQTDFLHKILVQLIILTSKYRYHTYPFFMIKVLKKVILKLLQNKNSFDAHYNINLLMIWLYQNGQKQVMSKYLTYMIYQNDFLIGNQLLIRDTHKNEYQLPQDSSILKNCLLRNQQNRDFIQGNVSIENIKEEAFIDLLQLRYACSYVADKYQIYDKFMDKICSISILLSFQHILEIYGLFNQWKSHLQEQTKEKVKNWLLNQVGLMRQRSSDQFCSLSIELSGLDRNLVQSEKVKSYIRKYLNKGRIETIQKLYYFELTGFSLQIMNCLQMFKLHDLYKNLLFEKNYFHTDSKILLLGEVFCVVLKEKSADLLNRFLEHVRNNIITLITEENIIQEDVILLNVETALKSNISKENQRFLSKVLVMYGEKTGSSVLVEKQKQLTLKVNSKLSFVKEEDMPLLKLQSDFLYIQDQPASSSQFIELFFLKTVYPELSFKMTPLSSINS